MFGMGNLAEPSLSAMSTLSGGPCCRQRQADFGDALVEIIRRDGKTGMTSWRGKVNVHFKYSGLSSGIVNPVRQSSSNPLTMFGA